MNNRLITFVMVSSVPPCLRMGELARTLRQAQPALEYECVVATTSESQTETATSQHPRIKTFATAPSSSLLERWREAIRLAQGRFLAWIDPGDWYSATRAQEQIRLLEASRLPECFASTVTAFNIATAKAWTCEEATPGPLARKTWMGDRLRLARIVDESLPPYVDRLTSDESQSNEQQNRSPVISAPWHLWMLHGTALPSLPSARLSCSPTSIANPIERLRSSGDLPFFAALRNQPKRNRPLSPARARARRLAAEPTVARPRGSKVSCIMPTWNRASYMSHALQCFARQTYPDRELIVIDDSDTPSFEIFEGQANVRYFYSAERKSIGEKRNLAVERATGDYFICWDDDDWYGQNRIRYQLDPILSGSCDATALCTGYILDLGKGQFWRKPRPVKPGESLFQQGVNWGTIAWSRQAQDRAAAQRFPHTSLAEDLAFRNELVRHGARVRCMENQDCYVYVRHSSNTWQFEAGSQLRRDHWQAIPPPDFFPESSRAFYGLALAEAQAVS